MDAARADALLTLAEEASAASRGSDAKTALDTCLLQQPGSIDHEPRPTDR